MLTIASYKGVSIAVWLRPCESVTLGNDDL